MTDLPSDEEYDAFGAHLEELMRNAADRDEWQRFDILMGEAATAPHPYLVHAYVLGCMTGRMVEDAIAEEVYLLWASLGDWYELRVGERVDAESYMKAAAQEWLALPAGRDAQTRYLSSWNAKLDRRLSRRDA